MRHLKGLFKAFIKAVGAAWAVAIPFLVADRVFGWISSDTYYTIWYVIIITSLVVFIGQYILNIRNRDEKSTDKQHQEDEG